MPRDVVRKGSGLLFGAALLPLPFVSLTLAGAAAIRAMLTTRRRSPASRAALAAVVVGSALFVAPSIAVEGWTLEAGTALGIGVLLVAVAAGLGAGRRTDDGEESSEAVGVLGTAAVTALASTISFLVSGERVSALGMSPNLWAATVVAGIAAALALPRFRGRPSWTLALVGLGAVTVAATGSRTATLALVVAVTVWMLQRTRTGRGRRLVLLGLLVGLAAAVAIGLSPLVDRFGGPQDLPERNRVLASEELTSPLWSRRDVRVEERPEGSGLAQHSIVATSTDGLARLHQRHVLGAGRAATFSVELRGDHVDEAGLHVFSEAGGRVSVDATGAIRTERTPPTIESYDVSETDDGWRRLSLTLRNDSDRPSTVRIGIAPSLAGRPDTRIEVRQPSLTAPDDTGAYEPTTEADRRRALALLSARQRPGYVAVAFDVFLEAPWLGHGPSSDFAALADRFAPGRLIGSDRPTHAHSLPMAVLVEHGLLGALGLLTAFAAMAVRAGPHVRNAMLPYLAAMTIANLGDATLLTGWPLYAALAVALRIALRDGGEGADVEHRSHASELSPAGPSHVD